MSSRVTIPTKLEVAQSTIRVLTLTQSLSSATFSTFLILHLTAPLAAIFAPPSKAEQWSSGFMVLGRVYYMGEWSEGVVVWGSLAVHIASGVTKRLVKGWERKERRKVRRAELKGMAESGGKSIVVVEGEKLKDEKVVEVEDEEKNDETDLEKASSEKDVLEEIESEKEIEVINLKTTVASTSFLGPFTLHHITGYILIPFALHHSWLHRLLPATPTAPISGLSPTLFSYSFVSYSLTAPTYRLISAVSYAAMATVGTYHVLSGIRRNLDPMAPPGLKPRRKTLAGRKWQATYGAGLVGLGIGVARLASEGGSVPLWIGRKYDVVLRQGFAF